MLVAAALAQPEIVSIERRDASLLGIRLPRLRAGKGAFRLHYGPGGMSESLDRAAAGFAAVVPELLKLAEEDAAVRNLRRGLAQTGRRLNALDKDVLPRLDREIRDATAAIEEEERDEAFRRQRWLGAERG